MPSNVRLDHQRRAVLATVTGEVKPPEVAPIVAEVRQQAMAHGYAILYDVSAADVAGISRSDLYWFTRTLPELKGNAAKRVRVAIVHAADTTELAHFWETTATNSGFQARAFTDREAAMTWVGEAAAGPA